MDAHDDEDDVVYAMRDRNGRMEETIVILLFLPLGVSLATQQQQRIDKKK